MAHTFDRPFHAARPGRRRRQGPAGPSDPPPDEETSDEDFRPPPWPVQCCLPPLRRAANTVRRRRHIDPTTCERDYLPEEVEFMQAVERYKRRSGRMFPTCSELLEVVRDLGYVRTTAC